MALDLCTRGGVAAAEIRVPLAAACTPMHALRSLTAKLRRRLTHPAPHQGFPARHRSLTCAGQITHHNPWDYTPEDRSLESATFGTDEFSRQQRSAGKVEEAKGAALKILSSRSHSRKELKAKLEERGYLPEAIAAALDRLQAVGLQSDAEFAEVFACSKWRQTKWGPSRIKSELKQRGVEPAHVQAALRGVFGEGLDVRRFLEEEADEAQDHVAGLIPEAALLQAAREQYQRTAGLSAEARRRRLTGWLQRRGHAWSDVARVLQRIEAEQVAAGRERAERHHDGD